MEVLSAPGSQVRLRCPSLGSTTLLGTPLLGAPPLQSTLSREHPLLGALLSWEHPCWEHSLSGECPLSWEHPCWGAPPSLEHTLLGALSPGSTPARSTPSPGSTPSLGSTLSWGHLPLMAFYVAPLPTMCPLGRGLPEPHDSLRFRHS